MATFACHPFPTVAATFPTFPAGRFACVRPSTRMTENFRTRAKHLILVKHTVGAKHPVHNNPNPFKAPCPRTRLILVKHPNSWYSSALYLSFPIVSPDNSLQQDSCKAFGVSLLNFVRYFCAGLERFLNTDLNLGFISLLVNTGLNTFFIQALMHPSTGPR